MLPGRVIAKTKLEVQVITGVSELESEVEKVGDFIATVIDIGGDIVLPPYDPNVEASGGETIVGAATIDRNVANLSVWN